MSSDRSKPPADPRDAGGTGQPESLESLLAKATSGDAAAAAALLPRVYDELRRIAGAYLADERKNHTLQPTALVHEAYLRLVGRDRAWQGRAHFLATAAVAMRRILVDHARRRAAEKRRIDEQLALADPTAPGAFTSQLLELDQRLIELHRLDERKARVVEMRFFAGMTLEQVADALGVARSTVADDWAVARAWLASRLSAEARS